MAGGVFHVEFGINETNLTRALEQGNFVTAEKLIRDTNNPSFLDEGCYQRTPLFICLCGMDEEEKRVRPRNLYLAKLMIEHGANVNFRVPTTYFGSEFESPGLSPLELLTDFYNDLTKHRHHYGNEPWTTYHCGWDPHIDVVVGLNKQYLTTLEEVIEHVEDIMFVILTHGGDANVADLSKLTPLHKTSIFSYDNRLLKLLVENGGNLNALDTEGSSPLLLNIANRRGQTALFHCVIRGDVDASYKLLKAGASPSIRGVVWETRKKKRKLSPIFASFLSIPIQRTLSWQNMHHKLATAPHQFGHLVDLGYFNTKEIVEEMTLYIENEFPEFSDLKSVSHKLVNSMFGRTTATLQQLAARKIFHSCFLEGSSSLGKLMPAETLKNRYSNADLKHWDVYDEYVTLGLNQAVLRALVIRLNLPQDSELNFKIELLLHRMASKFSTYKVLQPETIFGGDDTDNSNDSNSESQDEGDSDLEYW
ncbi:uncharacterized protein LOC132555891 [Ylistrum balloti]|uniref:uncharacterized protein LOC132555891 n=1 Tax=Ylistrum balloti TaxID=509963 RepID=UPI0029059E78|nr:uncharacterized protein LOC132555891 [Ylistrum balloti]